MLFRTKKLFRTIATINKEKNANCINKEMVRYRTKETLIPFSPQTSPVLEGRHKHGIILMPR